MTDKTFAGGYVGPLIKVGFWDKDNKPQDSVNKFWDKLERKIVIEHLRQGTIRAEYKGTAQCRICGIDVGSTDLTDGKYVWPSGLEHYLKKHNVEPPSKFILHALKLFSK